MVKLHELESVNNECCTNRRWNTFTQSGRTKMGRRHAHVNLTTYLHRYYIIHMLDIDEAG